jgi:hypothetical protein
MIARAPQNAPAPTVAPEPEAGQPAPLSPANQRLAAAKGRRDAAVIEQNALAAEIDAAEKLIAAGTSIGPEIARRLEVWTTGEGEDGPDLPSREELEPLRKSYKLALAAQAEMSSLRERLQQAHGIYMAAGEAVKTAAAEVIIEDTNVALVELRDTEHRALAIRAKINGAYRFLERAATTKRMGPIGSPVTGLAEGLRRRIPQPAEVSITAVQGEVAGWDERFEKLIG